MFSYLISKMTGISAYIYSQLISQANFANLTRTVLVISVLILTLWYMLKFYLSQRRIVNLGNKFPGPPMLPILGNAWHFTGKTEDIFPKVKKLMETYGRIEPFRVWFGWQLYVVVCKPADIQIVLNKAIQKGDVYRFSLPWTGHGLFTAPVTKWRRNRKTINPTFAMKVLETFVPIFQAQNRVLVDKLRPLALKGEVFDIFEFVSPATLDIICETAMGYRLNAQDDHTYTDLAKRSLKIESERMYNVFYYPDMIFYRTSQGKEFMKGIKYFRGLTNDVIKRKRKEQEAKKNRNLISNENNDQIKTNLEEQSEIYNTNENSEYNSQKQNGGDQYEQLISTPIQNSKEYLNKNNASILKQNETNLKHRLVQDKKSLQQNGDLIKQNGDLINQNGDLKSSIKQNGDLIQQNGDLNKQNGVYKSPIQNGNASNIQKQVNHESNHETNKTKHEIQQNGVSTKQNGISRQQNGVLTSQNTYITSENIDITSKNNEKVSKTLENETESDFFGGVSKKQRAFLDLLMEITKDDAENWTDQQLNDEVSTMMIAGNDTTAAVVSFTLVMLGIHRDVQEQIASEIRTVFGSGSDRDPAVSDLSRLELLDRAVKETMRLFPIGPLIVRKCDQDIELEKNTIPSGASIAIGIYGLHRDPSIWPNPDKFDPDRFKPELCAQRHPYAYIPFSAGPRNCIGIKYAKISLLMMLSTIMRNYEIICDYKIEDIQLQNDLMLKPSLGHLVRLIPRKL